VNQAPVQVDASSVIDQLAAQLAEKGRELAVMTVRAHQAEATVAELAEQIKASAEDAREAADAREDRA
jgi:predicted transcriptional regulator